MQRTPTRLELHRLKYTMGGCVGPLLSYDELDEKELKLISSDFFDSIVDKEKEDLNKLFMETLSSWGVMCVHPKENRDQRDGFFLCGCCGCAVIDKLTWSVKKDSAVV